MDDNHTLSHTTWNCKYHVVFAPKYRRKDKDLKKLIRYAEKLGIKKEVTNFVGMYYE